MVVRLLVPPIYGTKLMLAATPQMTPIILLGAGKIGETIAQFLHGSGDYTLTVADQDPARLTSIAALGVKTTRADFGDARALAALVGGNTMAISACPYYLTPAIAKASVDSGAHYFDLTEDVESTRRVKALAAGAGTALVPQCGLAPGFISILARAMTRKFESLRDVQMRVGALPQFPTNAFKYNLTWSTDGLINEYCNPCEAIVDGKMLEVLPLEEVEAFSLDGVDYEAFNTSGGLGTLCETLAGKVRTLNYRTIRYPGHAAIMKALLHDLRLKDRRGVLKDILEQALPATMQDVVIVFVTVAGLRDGRLQQDTYARKIYSHVLAGRMRSAIQITTAASLCTMLDLLVQSDGAAAGAPGVLPRQGFVRQEEVPLAAFLGNRFGRVYAMDALAHAA